MSSYLRVTNWTRYQHYKDRKPPWVKFYVELNGHSNKLNELPVSTRYLFDRCLLLAAEYSNAIPNDPELIANLLRMPRREVREGIDQLVKGRWLSHSKTKRRASSRASKMLASETETETERTTADTARTENPNSNGYGLEGAIIDLVRNLKDRDGGTEGVVRGLVREHRLAEGHVRIALEAATGRGVKSPTRVAIAELKKQSRRAA